MINVEDFVTIIHGAAMQTHIKLREQNLKLLDDYFQINVPTEPTKEFHEDENFQEVMGLKTEELRRDIEEATAKGRSTDRLEELLEIAEERDEKWLYYTQGKEAYLQKSFYATTMRARMIELDYPDLKNENAPSRKIQVPLIALVPITQSELAEVKFKVNLELSLETDKDGNSTLQVTPGGGFGQPTFETSRTSQETPQDRSSSSLEMTVTPHRGSEGLRLLVEGFEKILRAQLPH